MGALILLLVIVGIGVLLQLRGSNDVSPAASDLRSPSPTVPATPSASPSSPTSSPASSPATSPTSTPTTTKPAGPPRRCWDDSRVAGDETCPVPRGVRGLVEASPAFAAARQNGQCRTLPTSSVAAGYLCTVRGVPMRFAWFRTPAQLDARFDRYFAFCRTVSYLSVCQGAGGTAIRYADPDFVLEVGAQPANRRVLLRLPFNPSIPMMRGTAVG